MPSDRRPIAFFSSISALFFGLAIAAIASADVKAVDTLVVKGNLAADFRSDLTADSKVWTNHATGDASVGDLARADKGKLATTPTAGPDGKTDVTGALHLTKSDAQTLFSAKPVPSTISGSSDASLEVWVKATDPLDDHATVVAYGTRENGKQRQFLYGNVKPFAGFFADLDGWGTFTPDAEKWHLVTWVYTNADKSLAVYVDGKQVQRGGIDLDTSVSPLGVGAGPDEGSATSFTTDMFAGDIAVIRLESGLLSADDVKHNFEAGIAASPSPVTVKQ